MFRIMKIIIMISVSLGTIVVAHGRNPLGGSYQEFNKWGVNFEYPKSFKELSQDQLINIRTFMSKELASSSKTELFTCGERFIREFTMLTLNKDAALTVTMFRFKKGITVDCLLRERKESLSNVPPKDYEVKPGLTTNVLLLEKIRIGGYGGVIEDVLLVDRNYRAFGLNIIAKNFMYNIGLIAQNKNIFAESGKVFTHIIGSIEVR